MNRWAVKRKAARDAIPANRVEVAEHYDRRHISILTREGERYFVDGKPVTLKGAFRWFIEYEDADGGGGTCAEIKRLLKAVAKLLK